MAACIPVLHLCQEANKNWISDEVIEFVARKLDLSAAHVKGVVTFYTLFNQEPPGKHQLWVCRTLSCAMRGCDDLQGTIERKLGIGPGEKTPDGKFSFELVECLGSCGTAPMMRMNNRYWENLSVEKLERIIDACREGRDPSSEDFNR